MKNVTVQERLGGGNYGEVFRGIWKVIFNLRISTWKIYEKFLGHSSSFEKIEKWRTDEWIFQRSRNFTVIFLEKILGN